MTEQNTSLLKLSCSEKNGVEWKDAKCSRVKVVSVMTEADVVHFSGTSYATRKHLTWVTAAPELEKFCTREQFKALKNGELLLRIKQWLGLKAEKNYTWIMEAWVDPQRLQRPCSDPSVVDANCSERREVVCQSKDCADFKSWFEGYFKQTQETGDYPFTGLGYTFDWAPESKATATPGRGATEFVMMPGTSYEIVEAGGRPLTEYCGRKPEPVP